MGHHPLAQSFAAVLEGKFGIKKLDAEGPALVREVRALLAEADVAGVRARVQRHVHARLLASVFKDVVAADVARRSLSLLPNPFLVDPDRSDAMRVCMQCIPKAHSLAVLKVWFNGWTTRTRLRDRSAFDTPRMFCCFGCSPPAPDRLSHYLACPSLERVLAEVGVKWDAEAPASNACLELTSRAAARATAVAAHLYHAVHASMPRLDFPALKRFASAAVRRIDGCH